MTTSDERRATGREIQGQLWPAILKGPGGQFPAAKLAPDYFDHVQQSAFGDIWSRPGLPVRDRSMIVEVIMHTSIYAGVPAAGSAMRVAAEVLGTD